MDRNTRILVAIISALAIIIGALISGIFLLISVGLKNPSQPPPVSVSTPINTPTNPSVLPLGTTPPPATGSGSCQGNQIPSHDPNQGSWTIGGNYFLVVHIWTNLTGYSQQERALLLTPGEIITYKGGGSAWSYGLNCGNTAQNAYNNDSSSLPGGGTNVDQLRNEGLIA